MNNFELINRLDKIVFICVMTCDWGGDKYYEMTIYHNNYNKSHKDIEDWFKHGYQQFTIDNGMSSHDESNIDEYWKLFYQYLTILAGTYGYQFTISKEYDNCRKVYRFNKSNAAKIINKL